MKTTLHSLSIALALLALATINFQLSTACAQGTAFTYQGRLNSSGAPVSGSYDLTFSLFTTNAGGSAIAGPVTNSAVVVSNGLFTTLINFGNAFNGGSNWLEIAVRTNGGSSFTTLAPRQQITPTPYAVTAENVAGAISVQNNTNGAPNIIGGSSVNYAANGVIGATIGGGGTTNYYGAAFTNSVTGNFGTVGGGAANAANNYAATVGGGEQNKASGDTSTVSGGFLNVANSFYATVGGGGQNTASGQFATVSGGDDNSASGQDATTGGGINNNASGSYATVSGGDANTASGQYATVIGGFGNYATGDYSFAGGRQASAPNQGDFVWADDSGAGCYAFGTNQFVVRATGGVIFYSSMNSTPGVSLASGSGSWSSLSDRNAKENFQPVDAQTILNAVAAMPMTTWNYKTQAKSIRHVGPMAQDFAAAFHVGENDTTISTVDEGGVALAAIQGLNQKLNEKDSEIQTLKQQNDSLAERLNELEAMVKSLAEKK